MARSLSRWRLAGVPQAKKWPGNFRSLLRAAINDPATYSFRCNRELIDWNDSFRFFQWENEEFVLKRSSITRAFIEKRQSAEAQRRLSLAEQAKIVAIQPKVIRTKGDVWLLSNYLGISLHEEVIENNGSISPEAFASILSDLFECGVKWRGFAPRNLIALNERFFLAIDWEDVEFVGAYDSWDDLTRTKILMNWSQIFPLEQCKEIFDTLIGPVYFENSLDEFEIALYQIDGRSEADSRIRAGEIACFSELPFNHPHISSLTPQEIGHLVSDIWGSPLDLVFAILVLRGRSISETSYSTILREFTERLEECLLNRDSRAFDRSKVFKASMRSHLLWVLDTLSLLASQELCAPLRRQSSVGDLIAGLDNCRDRRGIRALKFRSSLLIEFCKVAFRILQSTSLFPKELQLILRGSMAQGMASIYSDVDFEISSPNHVLGHLQAEKIFSLLLELGNIKSEGSEDRPYEADVRHGELARDAQEWLELRDPFGSPPWPHFGEQRNIATSPGLGLYERNVGNPITPKLFWNAVRSAIARAALASNCHSADSYAQLRSISWELGPTLQFSFKKLLISSLRHYEEGIAVSPFWLAELDRACRSAKVPTAAWIIRELSAISLSGSALPGS